MFTHGMRSGSANLFSRPSVVLVQFCVPFRPVSHRYHQRRVPFDHFTGASVLPHTLCISCNRRDHHQLEMSALMGGHHHGDAAKYLSHSVTSLGSASTYVRFNNPIEDFHGNESNLQEALASNGVKDGKLGLQLRIWQGPLEGIVHQQGQFPELTEDSKSVHAATPLSPAVAADLEVLLKLRDDTQHVLYNSFASESDYSLLPVIFRPPAALEPSGKSRNEAGGQAREHEGGDSSAAASAAAADHAKQLTAADLLSSLGINQRAAALFKQPEMFHKKEEWLRYMESKHIKASSSNDLNSPEQHFQRAVRKLADAVEPPLLQVIIGNEELTNPVLLAWLGRSKTGSGNILGLLTAVVWT